MSEAQAIIQEIEELREQEDRLNGTPKGGRGGTVPPEEHRFKPGQSGNPGGRPKTAVISALLRQLLDADDQAFAKAFVISLFRQACLGNHVAMRMVVDRLEGTVGTRGEIVDVDVSEPVCPWPNEDADA